MRYSLLLALTFPMFLSGCLGGIQDQMAKDAKMTRVRDCERRTVESEEDGKKVIQENIKCKEYKEPKR